MQYEAREIMIVEGAQSACVHWILKGSCRALKKVKFVKRETGTIIGGGKKYSLVAYTDGMPLEETDEVVEQMLCAMELTPGSLYPEFPRYKHYSNQESSIQMALSDEERNINKLELIARLTYEDPDDQALGSYYSIVANTKCEIAVMSRVDYVRLASNEMVKSVLMDRESYIVPVQRLQDVFLEKRNWDMYKRKVVAGLVSGGK
ncbi:uncharacterized protein BJ171DRAFT_67807 [Polychytrium aggregatum]|uniref:uncharacterized protein n=1 Tax=Polychytrium aggregatum TaxID=110093 RepID=UPI0022FDD37A|nr:uncharacterized protein BJ171DRAFT_67807 [Polychytrium aggregatum]KAI9190716.1 hypothetical protein BJ171DRAFT_67807 [Polychytrium aggregatum]